MSRAGEDEGEASYGDTPKGSCFSQHIDAGRKYPIKGYGRAQNGHEGCHEICETAFELAEKRVGRYHKERDEEEEDEDEIDIETDSVSAFEDPQGVVARPQETCERLRVIQPTDLRVNQEARSPGSGSDKPKDVNNNKNGNKPPITKNWLIPEDTSE